VFPCQFDGVARADGVMSGGLVSVVPRKTWVNVLRQYGVRTANRCDHEG